MDQLQFIITVLVLLTTTCMAQNGQWTDSAEGCIRDNNDWAGSASSYGACQLSCEEQTAFTCLSIDYYYSGSCHHSRFNRNSIRPTSYFTQPCYTGTPWVYSERQDIDYAWTDIALGCIRNNNDKIVNVDSVKSCQKLCQDETSFVCLSIDYKDGNCHLSRFNRVSIRPTSDFTQPCYVADWTYSERRDKDYYWTDTALACIRNNNEWTGRVSSFAVCQNRCINEKAYSCLSIDYKGGNCHLSRYSRNTVQPNSDFTQPCYVSGWSYAERVNVAPWTPVVDGCIRNHNIRSISVPDIESCKILCSQHNDCCSIDYYNGNCNLSGNNEANVSPHSDYTEPCYNGQPWKYSERTDKFCPY